MPRNKSEKPATPVEELIAFAHICEKHDYYATRENERAPLKARKILSGVAKTLLLDAPNKLYKSQADYIFNTYGRG